MPIEKYEPGDFVNAGQIYCDTNIVEKSNVYAIKENYCGQGCSTVWFNSVPECRAFLRINGKVPSGYDIDLCGKCRCHYSINDPLYEKFEDYACKNYKKSITKKASEIFNKNPKLGRKNISKEFLDSIIKNI